MSELNVGFIGFGNMAQAMAEGFLRTGALRPEQIHPCARNWEKLCANTEPRGIRPCRDSREVVEASDLVILAVKPYLLREVTEPIRGLLREKTVVSVAAGYPFEKLDQLLLPGTHHLSTCPNTPVAVAEGIIVCEERHSLTEEEFRTVKQLFEKVALVETVDTAHLSVAGTVCGCTPAYAAMFIEALGDAGVKHGLTRAQSYRLAAQMLVGTGKLYLETGQHPGAMKDAVCSPGGTTIVGVASLERSGFRSAVIDAIDAVENRQ